MNYPFSFIYFSKLLFTTCVLLLCLALQAQQDSVMIQLDNEEKLVLSRNSGTDLLMSTPSSRNNLFIGDNTGRTNNTGLFNTAVGNSAFSQNIGGNLNSAFGYNALFKNRGGFNVGLGEFALGFNENGNYNTAVGSHALAAGNGGSYNIALGYNAGTNLAGDYNIALGYDALRLNTLGNRNIAIGDSAGYQNILGDGNIFIGHRSGTNITGSNKLVIENQALDSTQALIFGDFAKDELRANASTMIYSMSTDLATLSATKTYPIGTNSDVPSIRAVNTIDDFYGVGVEALGAYTGVIARGIGSGGGSYYGVRASSTNSNSGSNYGIYADASGASSNYGIYAKASGGTSQWAGYFIGNNYYSGSLAIGVPSPKEKIHNVGAYYGPGNIKLHALSGDGNNGTAYVQAIDDSGTSSIDLSFRTQNTGSLVEAMQITKEGNVGIGTISVPSGQGHQLTIAEATEPVIFRLERSDAGRWDYEILNDGGSLIFRGGADALGSSLTEHMKINSDGRVGIGTSTLASGYKLSVDGKVASEEILVEVSGSWPDYVFKEDYQLKSLIEVENHIAEHGHLPGVPSAKVAESDGIELGEMNRILLEKVEELTLHLIDQQKQLEEQKKLIDQLISQSQK